MGETLDGNSRHAVSWFATLTDDDWAAASQRVNRVSLDAGQTLFRRGDASGPLYVLVAGQVEVRADVAGGSGGSGGLGDGSNLLATLDPVVTIGELACLTGERRNATIVASAPAELWEISRAALDQAATARESWAVVLMLSTAQGLARRLGRLDRQLASLTADAPPRFSGRPLAVGGEFENLRRILAEWSF